LWFFKVKGSRKGLWVKAACISLKKVLAAPKEGNLRIEARESGKVRGELGE
jgi:hypothetical protein